MTIAAARDQIAGSIGERPRFVWMMTPVALMTRRSVDAVEAASAFRNVIGRDIRSSNASPLAAQRLEIARPPHPSTRSARTRDQTARTYRRTESAPPTGCSGARNLPRALALDLGMGQRIVVGQTVIKQDDELDKLEEDIRKLKNKYDQFFAGIQKFPPMHERRLLEVYIYELGKQKMRDNARRFRYSQLLTRYNQLPRVVGPQDARAGRRSSRFPAPLGGVE